MIKVIYLIRRMLLLSLSRKVEKDLHTALGIQAKVKLMEPKSIQRSEGKAKRIIDNRQI